jgi:hypothetical protein
MAEVARVSGGEHADFTRLVVEGTTGSDWVLGRSEDGYELRLPKAVTSYDVTDAFEKIPRNRLAALWQDPETGGLRFSLACACHAIAFEFRSGIVVIDIRNGSAPEGSAFEMPLDSNSAPAAATPDQSETAAAALAYDWVALQREAKSAATAETLPLPTGGVSLDPLRDALLAEISKGASEGVVEIAEGGVRPAVSAETAESGPWSRLSVGELPGLSVNDPDRPRDSMTSDGRACAADSILDVAGWGGPGSVAGQLGLARSGLLTEFDAPVEEAVLRSARFHLFLGFGAEALQTLGFLDGETTEELPYLQAMAYIVDVQAPKSNPFSGMETCDTAAALWAVLAAGGDERLAGSANADAVSRSFSALPLHLRRHLGPSLVDLFLEAGDQETARQIRDATMRVPSPGNPEVTLLDATYNLAEGNESTARELAEDVMAQMGPGSAKAAVTLIEATFRGDRSLDPTLPSAVDLFLRDALGTEDEAKLRRASVLAHAMTGDFASAFANGTTDSETFSDLWSMAVEATPDSQFLEAAARSALSRPKTRDEVELAVAERLLNLGMAELALGWLKEPGADSPEAHRLLAGTAYLGMRDPRRAMESVEGLSGEAAERIRASAMLQLGDAKEAAQRLVSAGDAAGAERTAVWTRDWTFVMEAGPEVWRQALETLSQAESTPSSDPAQEGPIARGSQLVDESARARSAIEQLLFDTETATPSQ